MTRVTVWLGHLLIVGAAGLAAVFAVGVLAGSTPPVHVALPRFFPFVAMSLSVDGLSAFFLLVVLGVSAVAAVQAQGWEPTKTVEFIVPAGTRLSFASTRGSGAAAYDAVRVNSAVTATATRPTADTRIRRANGAVVRWGADVVTAEPLSFQGAAHSR